ncbi:MAG: hypothetical protein JMDDDDMK_04120 [Acidobacteria bacterium]|nr:hypothetical protein [Acidobacteriota bacterium]
MSVEEKSPASRPKSKSVLDLAALIKQTMIQAGVGKQFALILQLGRILYPKESSDKYKGSQLKDILRGRKVPFLHYLLAIYLALRIEKENNFAQQSNPADEIKEKQRWAIGWLIAELESLKNETVKNRKPLTSSSEMKQRSRLPDNYIQEWVDAVESLKELIVEPATRDNDIPSLPTLDQFPDMFSPLIIITGTSRYSPPESISDLFNASARLTDLLFINRLKLPLKTLVIPDSHIINLDPRNRVRLLGEKNILLIGGPVVNAVTRALWKKSVFGFSFDERRGAFNEIYDELKRTGLLNTKKQVELFHAFLNSSPEIDYDSDVYRDRGPTKAERRKIYDLVMEWRGKVGIPGANHDQIKKIFYPNGSFDPVAMNEESAPGNGHDRALITLAPNIWDRGIDDIDEDNYRGRYVSVIVAGFSELGTALALKSLANPGHFKSHPLGGFLNVTPGQYSTDLEKITQANYEWDDNNSTPGYTVRSLYTQIKKQLSADSGERAYVLRRRFNDAELSGYCEFIERFLRDDRG